MKNVNDVRVNVRAKKLEIIRDYMAKGEKATIQYALKHNRSSNYYKYSIGQNRGIKRLNVIEKKKATENDFRQWVSESSERRQEYGGALELINEARLDDGDDNAYSYPVETLVRGTEIFYFANRFTNLKNSLHSKREKENIEFQVEMLQETVEKYFRDYNAETDMKLLAALARIYVRNVDEQYYPPFVKEIQNRYRGNYEKWAERVFKRTMFDNLEDVNKFLKRPDKWIIEHDPAFKYSRQVFKLLSVLRKEIFDENEKLDKGKRLFMKGLMEMYADKEFYPNANSTMRLTYGQIGGYEPADAVTYNYYTTHTGYLEKAIPGDREFDVWPKMDSLLLAEDFGPYADIDQTLHTCFISNNDITGGNSGSPVLNGRGELIGIAFDGNWEAMSGDIAFEPELQKCINVDIRFVLWVMDKFAGATHLIDEMTLLD